MDQKLLTLSEAAECLRLKNGASFSRFAKRHSIPLVRIGRRIVRVRAADLEHYVREHVESHRITTEEGPGHVTTSIPILEKTWHQLHGSHKIQRGRLTATTDTDYLTWTCPECHEGLAGGAGLKLLGSHSDLSDPRANPHVLSLLFHCVSCGYFDYLKLPLDQFSKYGTGEGIEDPR